jgi:Tol biopolymer transport system component
MIQNGFTNLSSIISTIALSLLLLLTACDSKIPAIQNDIPTPIPVVPLAIAPTPILVPLDGRGGGVIAFVSWERNDWQIYRMNADGSAKTLVTVDVQGGYEPDWSPDGSKMVYQYGGLWIANIASGISTRIPLNAESNYLPNEYLVKPSWSPTGEWIAFVNESGTQGDIFLIKPDGSELRRLTDTGKVSRDGDLVWSPDGRYLAFSAFDASIDIDIFIMCIEDALLGIQNIQPVTNDPAPIRNLVTSWSFDGSWIAFSSDRDGNMDIYLMDPEGNQINRLTDDPAYDAEPNISRDGKLIAFSSNRDGNAEIYILETENTDRSSGSETFWRLTEHLGDDVGPVWKP